MRTNLALHVSGFCLVMLTLVMSATARAAIPESATFLHWGPHVFDIATPGDSIWSLIHPLDSYERSEYVERTDPGTSPSICTVPRLKAVLQMGQGVLCYAAHSSSGQWVVADTFCAVGDAAYQYAQDRMSEYIANPAYPELTSQTMSTLGPWGHGTGNIYSVLVSAAVTTGWCRQFCPTAQGISFTYSCVSAGKGTTCFNALCDFGYNDCPYEYQAEIDFCSLLDYMVPTSTEYGPIHSASEARNLYHDGTSPIVVLSGNGDYFRLVPTMSLCPGHDAAGPPNSYSYDNNGRATFGYDVRNQVAMPVVFLGDIWLDTTHPPPYWLSPSYFTFTYRAKRNSRVGLYIPSGLMANIRCGNIYYYGNHGDSAQPAGKYPPNNDVLLKQFDIEP